MCSIFSHKHSLIGKVVFNLSNLYDRVYTTSQHDFQANNLLMKRNINYSSALFFSLNFQYWTLCLIMQYDV